MNTDLEQERIVAESTRELARAFVTERGFRPDIVATGLFAAGLREVYDGAGPEALIGWLTKTASNLKAAGGDPAKAAALPEIADLSETKQIVDDKLIAESFTGSAHDLIAKGIDAEAVISGMLNGAVLMYAKMAGADEAVRWLRATANHLEIAAADLGNAKPAGEA